jgi:hypothetical protein
LLNVFEGAEENSSETEFFLGNILKSFTNLCKFMIDSKKFLCNLYKKEHHLVLKDENV